MIPLSLLCSAQKVIIKFVDESDNYSSVFLLFFLLFFIQLRADFIVNLFDIAFLVLKKDQEIGFFVPLYKSLYTCKQPNHKTEYNGVSIVSNLQ